MFIWRAREAIANPGKVYQWLSFEQDYVMNTIGSLRYWMMTSKAAQRPKELDESTRAAGIKALRILN